MTFNLPRKIIVRINKMTANKLFIVIMPST